MYPHRIRLHGPWDYEPLARTVLHADGRLEVIDGPLPPRGRMTVPGRWADRGPGAFAGRMRFRRTFQWPAGLDFCERLWLVFAGADYFTTVRLNGELLGRHEGAFDPFAFDISALVQLRNELTVEVDLPAVPPETLDRQRMVRGSSACPTASGGLWGSVALEVRREAFLRGVRLEATFADPAPMLRVAGEVAGTSDRPLEVYITLDGETVREGRVEARPEGSPFELSAPVPSAECWRPSPRGRPRLYEAAVHLIDPASKLDTQVRRIGFRVPGAGPREPADPVDLMEPVAAGEQFGPADEAGAPRWVCLPFRGGYADDDRVRAEAVRQARAIVAALAHHPSIAGWVCHRDPREHDAALDRELCAAVRALDPTRPCVAGGG